jgi:uncharacterized membrane protein
MEMLLLIAVLVLIALHVRLSARVRALEALLEGKPAEPAQPVATGASRERQSTAMAGATPPSPEVALRTGAQPRLDAPEEAQLPAERPAGTSLAGLFEQFVGGRLLIWIGGIALAVAGIFLVRFSAGLITPAVRMVLAGLFGLVLLAGGELARSRSGSLPDPRVPQALVGAGILVLYAAPYGALTLYQLISIATASTLMVTVTAAALILSLRHGAPAGVMGLAGGFATPLLVGDPASGAVPLLGYLALLDIALFALASRRGWTWLAAGAVLLSLVWSGLLLGQPRGDALAAGGFIVALSIGASVLRVGPGWHLDFIRPALLGLVELAVLVARTDLGAPAWLLFAALSAASFLLATRRADYRPIPAVALAIALLLILLKVQLGKELLPEAAGVTLLFGLAGMAFALARRERLLWASVASGAFSGPVLIFRLMQPGMVPDSWYGIAAMLLAAGPLLLAWLTRHDEDGKARAIATATALLLAAVGLSDLVPGDLVPAVWLILSATTALAAGRLGDERLSRLALAVVGAALLMAAARIGPFWNALLMSFAGVPPLAGQLPTAATALFALALPGVMLVALLRLIAPGARGWLLGAALFCLVAAAYILFKRGWALADAEDFVARGFAERLIFTQALFGLGWLICRLPIPALADRERRIIGLVFTAVAAARFAWFDIAIANPVLVPQSVGSLPFANLLVPAYLLSAFWLYAARRASDSGLRSGIWLSLFLAALVAGVMLLVRQAFQGPILTAPIVSASESYAYSLFGLLLSLALLLFGIRLADKALRIAGLALLTATILKVFLGDASALEGLLRILSFLGLGVALIGIGKLYTKVLDAERSRDVAREGG